MRKQTLINKTNHQSAKHAVGRFQAVDQSRNQRLSLDQLANSLGSKKLWGLGCLSVAGLGLIAGLALCPLAEPATNAATSGNVKINVKAASNISLSLGSAISMTLNPGTASAGSTSVQVQTNNPTGYKVYMKTNNGGNTLKNTDTSISNVISSITANTVGTSLGNNVWGYALETSTISTSTTFKPIVAANTEIKSVTSASASGQTDSYNLGFGAKIDSTLPAGNYANEVTISVVANSF